MPFKAGSGKVGSEWVKVWCEILCGGRESWKLEGVKSKAPATSEPLEDSQELDGSFSTLSSSLAGCQSFTLTKLGPELGGKEKSIQSTISAFQSRTTEKQAFPLPHQSSS